MERVATHFAATGTPAELNKVLKALPTKNPPLAAAVINGLAAGWRGRGEVELDQDALKAIREMIERRPPAEPIPFTTPWYLPPDSKARLISLAKTWGVKGLDAQL